MKNKIFLIISILVILSSLSMIIKSEENTCVDKIKSINLATDYNIDQVLKDIDLVNANTVNVPVVINIKNLNSNDIKIDEYSKNKAIELIKILKEKNIKVILEAFPWIDNGSKYETQYNPQNKEMFFRNWKNILKVLINDVANVYDVEIINVASNFEKLEGYEDNWCRIIDFVKSKFNGLVTYRTSWWYTANWDEESIKAYNDKLNNKIFSEVDFISIACYFELSDKGTNTVEELVSYLSKSKVYNRNQNIKQEIKNFYEKYNKPIFFGELGFPRKNNAATEPWNMMASNTPNDKEQARCFESYKIVFENEDYIKGFSVFAMGEKSKDKLFYPSKESIEVISSWYKNYINK
ncbi:glycoside hydrolase family 113 [Romboutsia sp.]|uniref:glycoside hydrolase family 113 n=1 Tax=Romboutsia sp. TaxID=1965302 RepID=UPI003F399BAF